MRSETDDLTLGIGKLRWPDAEVGVRTLYPHAQSTPGYEGRNPRTGERVVVPPGLLIPRFLSAGNEALASAQVSFDASGISSVTLYCQPEGAPLDWAEPEASAAVARAANELARRFGFGPIAPEELETLWVIGDVRVEVFLEPAELSLTIHRPGEE